MVLRGSYVGEMLVLFKERNHRYWTPFVLGRLVGVVRDRILRCWMMISPMTICLMFLRVVFPASFKDLSSDGGRVREKDDALPQQSMIF